VETSQTSQDRIAELETQLQQAQAQIAALRSEAFAASRADEVDAAEFDRLRQMAREQKDERKLWQKRANGRARRIKDLERQIKELSQQTGARHPSQRARIAEEAQGLVRKAASKVRSVIPAKGTAQPHTSQQDSAPAPVPEAPVDADQKAQTARPEVRAGDVLPVRQHWQLEPVAFVLIGNDAEGVTAWLSQVKELQMTLASFKPLFIVDSDAAAALADSGYTYETVMSFADWSQISDDHAWAAFAAERVTEITDTYGVKRRLIGSPAENPRAMAAAAMTTAPVGG